MDSNPLDDFVNMLASGELQQTSHSSPQKPENSPENSTPPTARLQQTPIPTANSNSNINLDKNVSIIVENPTIPQEDDKEDRDENDAEEQDNEDEKDDIGKNQDADVNVVFPIIDETKLKIPLDDPSLDKGIKMGGYYCACCGRSRTRMKYFEIPTEVTNILKPYYIRKFGEWKQRKGRKAYWDEECMEKHRKTKNKSGLASVRNFLLDVMSNSTNSSSSDSNDKPSTPSTDPDPSANSIPSNPSAEPASPSKRKNDKKKQSSESSSSSGRKRSFSEDNNNSENNAENSSKKKRKVSKNSNSNSENTPSSTPTTQNGGTFIQTNAFPAIPGNAQVPAANWTNFPPIANFPAFPQNPLQNLSLGNFHGNVGNSASNVNLFDLNHINAFQTTLQNLLNSQSQQQNSSTLNQNILAGNANPSQHLVQTPIPVQNVIANANAQISNPNLNTAEAEQIKSKPRVAEVKILPNNAENTDYNKQNSDEKNEKKIAKKVQQFPENFGQFCSAVKFKFLESFEKHLESSSEIQDFYMKMKEEYQKVFDEENLKLQYARNEFDSKVGVERSKILQEMENFKSKKFIEFLKNQDLSSLNQE